MADTIDLFESKGCSRPGKQSADPLENRPIAESGESYDALPGRRSLIPLRAKSFDCSIAG
jgi:hypothetical protein